MLALQMNNGNSLNMILNDGRLIRIEFYMERRIGIIAPKDIPIYRNKIFKKMLQNGEYLCTTNYNPDNEWNKYVMTRINNDNVIDD